jgi:hypothetical protein
VPLLEGLEARIATTRAPIVGEEAARLEAQARVRALLALPVVVAGAACAIWAQLGGSAALWLLVAMSVVGFALVARSAMTIARQSDRLAHAYKTGLALEAGARGEPPPATVRLAPRAAELALLIGEPAARPAALAQGFSLLIRYAFLPWVIVSVLLLATAPPGAAVPAVMVVLVCIEAPLLIGRAWLDRRAEQAADAFVSAQFGYPVHLRRGHRTGADWEAAIELARRGRA